MVSENIVVFDQEGFEASIASGVVLVDFYADWCGPCRMLAPILEEVAVHCKGKARVAKLNIDHAQQVTSKLQITSVPTLVLFKDGQEVKRIIGLRDADFVKDFVQSAY